MVKYHIDHHLVSGTSRAYEVYERYAVERTERMIAHGDKGPLGQIVEQLLIVYAQLYVEIVEQTAAERRARSIEIMVVNPVYLVDVECLHQHLDQTALALEERRHLYDVVIVEHSALHHRIRDRVAFHNLNLL